jgi:hypothetical protein
VQQAFQAIFQSDEDTEVGDLGDLALDHLARLVLVWNGGCPWIVVQLLETQSDTATVLVDRQDAALDFLALFQDFAWMADLASPRHVGDVQQAIDAFFQFDKRTVVGEVANLAGNQRFLLDT